MKRNLLIALTLLLAVFAQAQNVSFTAAEWATAKNLSENDAVTSYSQGDVTVNFSTGTGAQPTWSGKYIATVPGNTMTLSVPDGKVIKSATFTATVASHAERLSNSTWDSGKVTLTNTTVTWVGNAQRVSVTLKASVRLTEFAVTIAEPDESEDPSQYNDETTVSIIDWMKAEDVASGDRVDATEYQKDGKKLYADMGTGNQLRFYSSALGFYQDNTLKITAPYQMRKIVFTFSSEDDVAYFLGNDSYKDVNLSTCSTGSFKADDTDGRNVIWLGATTSLTITFGYRARLASLKILSDKTATGATVTFIGLDGETMKTEQVPFGSSATAPALPTTDEVGWVIRWDKDFSNVQGDLTVHAVREMVVHMNLTPVECDALKKYNKSTGLSFSSGNATVTLKGERDEDATRWAESEGKVVIFSYTRITISSPDIFRSVRLTALNDEDARNLAAAGFSTGKATSNGNQMVWRGETKTLTINYPGEQWAGEAGVTRFEVMSAQPPLTVTFLDKDGNVLKVETVAKGADAMAPAAPAVEGMKFTGWSVPFTNVTDDITTQAQYTLDDNYVKVTFVDYYGHTIKTQLVRIGEDAVAPAPPTIMAHTFTGWSAPLTNIQASQTIRAQYAFDMESEDILSVAEAMALVSDYKETSEMVVVKGIVFDAPNEFDGEATATGEGPAGGQLTFRISADGGWDWGESIQILRANSMENKPFTSVAQIRNRDEVYVMGRMRNYGDIQLVDGYLVYSDRLVNSDEKRYFDMPNASTLYDFDGNGKKIAPKQSSLAQDIRSGFVEDINRDGKPDVYNANDGYYGATWLSNDSGYELQQQMLIVPNMDLNRDGRPDYIQLNREASLNSGVTNYGDIMHQQSDGSFLKQTMQVMTWSEFLAQMTPEEKEQYDNPQNYSLGDVSRYQYVATLGGASLARAKRRAPGIGNTVAAPTKAIDFNGDGLVDLIDEKNGVIYTNMDNGKWVWTQTNGIVIPADLNADGITDFIFPGAKLYTSVFNKTTNKFTTTVLYQNAAVDDLVYCYDFDKDGDIDILTTFSSAKNNTGYAYTCFFINDGQGHFSQQPEQDYGSNELWFSALQDIDGDGNFDLLAFRGNEIVWLRGTANRQFAAPESLETFELGWNSLDNLTINAEDLDNDGKADLWLSGLSNNLTEIYPQKEATANVRPTAPAKPAVAYDKGILKITWGNGTDDRTATTDLTYALRIGTTAGGNEILAAHANADGTRRNFLDGNMGRTHTYTIDLRSYAPANLYVAVQTIDAQHSGSAWSEEAIVAHTYVPVEFTLDRTSININETAVLTFTALPEGYTHGWTVQDGSYTQDGSKLTLSFVSSGKKTITHTVTTPDNTVLTAKAVVDVMPAGVGQAIKNTETSSMILGLPLADYNFDGRLDGVMLSGYNTGWYSTMTIEEGKKNTELFGQAAGLWNTNILTSNIQYGDNRMMWYDYDRDGKLDFLFMEGIAGNATYAKMLHNATQPALTARQDDSNLLYLFEYGQSGSKPEDNFYGQSLRHDLTHNGLYDNLMMNPLSHYQLIEIDGKGGTEWKQFAVNGDAELFQSTVASEYSYKQADYNHDGWTDIIALGAGTIDQYGNTLTYGNLLVFQNGGGVNFTQKNIPFAQNVEKPQSYQLADLNGDGYLDVVARYIDSDYDYYDAKTIQLYVLWNNANTSFSAPDILPMSMFLAGNDYTITDVDNNGYPDVVAPVKNAAAGDGISGVYVWYMGQGGLLNHGFIIPQGGNYGQWVSNSLSDHYLAVGEHYLMANGDLYPIEAQTDARPAAPTGVNATLTGDGLLISWSAAVDDHTPASLMRYNLAVKQQGADTYLISPQNGLNADAAYLPGYGYIEATQFLIPTTYLTSGKYEISVQALDRQNKTSLFSETLVANVQRSPIEAPSTACAGNDITVSYRGSATTGTPTWNFDGATIVEGSGFGPYKVNWPYGKGGERHITLSLGGKTFTHTITINDPSTLNVSIPSVLYEGTPATASVPEGVTYQWYALIDGYDEPYPITTSGVRLPSTAPAGGSAVLRLDYRLVANGLNVKAVRNSGTNGTLVGVGVTLCLEVTNASGCSVWFEQKVTVMESTAIPTLSLVTTDASGHNVISWTNADAFSKVNIYREGNTLGKFELIGSADANAGSFTDVTSDAMQKAERYRITGVMANQEESPASATHQTVHLTISRGVTNGTFNLMWNGYAGASVTGYNILRGQTPATLRQIASVASSNTSYTDQTAADSEPYYAIEYILASPANVRPVNRAQGSLTGRSNVVDRRGTDDDIDAIELIVGDKTQKRHKVMINGKIYIIHRDKLYTPQGQAVK